ncbi:DinB family protein, partial [uncultured Eudoraea sp.]|uniref:DinB family protein n=1 Tax=uncultured Eudoraea sp. TaxID=1035614 RepID=UPI0026038BFF
QLWIRPNDNLVSIANLILHLEGNIRQWILTGIGNHPDHRKRDLEFSQTDRIDRKEMLSKLKDAIDKTIEVVNQIQDEEWTKVRSVQGYKESVLSIVIHVIEHFSYHTGQITYYTKLLTNKNTNYYGDQDLNLTAR